MADRKWGMNDRPATLLTTEYTVTNWYLSVPPHLSPEDLLDPSFWAIVATRMKPNQRVTVDSEDHSWTAEYFVLDASRTAARVALLNVVDIAAAKKSGAPGPQKGETYTIKWLSPTARYQIIRDRDSEEMARNLSKEEADAWVRGRAQVEAQ